MEGQEDPTPGLGAARGYPAPTHGEEAWWVPLSCPRSFSASFYEQKFIAIFLEFFEKLYKKAISRICRTILSQENKY